MGLRTDINFHARPSLNPPLRARVGAASLQSRRKHTESKALTHAPIRVYFLGANSRADARLLPGRVRAR